MPIHDPKPGQLVKFDVPGRSPEEDDPGCFVSDGVLKRYVIRDVNVEAGMVTLSEAMAPEFVIPLAAVKDHMHAVESRSTGGPRSPSCDHKGHAREFLRSGVLDEHYRCGGCGQEYSP